MAFRLLIPLPTRFERGFVVTDGWLGIARSIGWREVDADDVESNRPILELVLAGQLARQRGELSLLGSVDMFLG